jgi:hypothetical protein
MITNALVRLVLVRLVLSLESFEKQVESRLKEVKKSSTSRFFQYTTDLNVEGENQQIIRKRLQKKFF